MSEILGVLFAVLVGMMVIPQYSHYQTASNNTVRAAVTAQQLAQINTAATTYIQQNQAAIASMATPTTPVVVTVPMLKTAGLPAAFNANNPYGQTWQVAVLQPAPGTLQALAMATGGTAIPDAQAGKIASLVGATGGLIPQNDSGIYPGGAANAYGAFSGWQIPTAGYTGAAGGHPAALLNFTNGQLVNNYLYRNAVPGQPQVNQMNTAIDMRANNINNAGQVTASTIFTAGDASIGGVVTAQKVTVSSGNNLVVGSSAYYGDGTNSAIRQNGALYVQHYDGSAADLAGVGNISATGSINAAGTMTSNANSWGAVLNGAGAANAQQQNAIGSANVNDVYIRSIGKWVSQLGGGIKNYQDFAWSNGSAAIQTTGLSYLQWSCAMSQVGGKFAGGSENIQVYRDGASGNWVVSGSSGSDNSGAFGRVTCVQIG